ncbi:MAG TPA: heparan-alpha-glucosaminide N-acetyltransferase domain-containing protein [Gemmatimonadales bacterium]|nr:heparan-alpha-glucosaminide N-acetyltransferase domain-containing protein [Gemmatimonadales bacterium]
MALPSTAPPGGAPAPPLQQRTAPRLGSIDLLRGAVIVLMALDHVRYFVSDARFDPTDPARATVALFFTRWVTHFCAPVFMFLAGLGAWLSLGRGRDVASLSRFLWTRGLWLVLLEVTFARAAWQFNFDYGYTSALVLWALGWCMVALAGLVRLRPESAGWTGVGMIVAHNMFDGLQAAELGPLGPLWMILHEPGTITLAPGVELFVLYPLVPWIGVMAAGYGFGPLFRRPPAERDRLCLRLGLGLTAAFVVLRLVNGYGDPAPWAVQATPWRTALSFLNTTKYPPSLQFLLMTLGPAIALLPRLDCARGPLAGAVRTFGRVPLFFWLLHVPVIHLAAVALSVGRYGAVIPWLVRNPPAAAPQGYGYSLAVVYAVTIAVVAALYPVCRWFAGVKQRRRDGWLGYL